MMVDINKSTIKREKPQRQVHEEEPWQMQRKKNANQHQQMAST